MASGSSANSPVSDNSNTDPEIFVVTDDEFEDWKLVMGLNESPVDDWAVEDLSGIINEVKKVCIGRKNDGVSWGFCMERGYRRYMEDKVVIFPALMSMTCGRFGGCIAPDREFAAEESPIHYFAVFDGHGGSQVSDYCADSLHIAVKEAWLFEGCTDTNTNGWNKRWESILCNSYDIVDKACGQDLLSGSTAVVVLVSSCQIVVANCGDSRAVLCRGSHTIALTNDHKPNRNDEEERIIKSGGHVVEDPRGVMRVDGVLAMTRAIGDYSMKPYVSAVPELSFSTRSEEDECLIIASDGLWDVMPTEVVGNIASQLLQNMRDAAASSSNKTPPQYVAEYLFKEAISRGSNDNISVIVVDLKQG